MIKGLMFFINFAWKNEKKYLIFRTLNQFIYSMIPVVAILMPRFIINELMEKQRIEYLIIFDGILILYTFVASSLSTWLSWTSFNYRIKLAQDFTNVLH